MKPFKAPGSRNKKNLFAAIILGFSLLFVTHLSSQAQSVPIPNGFAHNDYKHQHPLFDALDYGFTNIEADVFLEDTTLVVGHFCPLFRHGHNLENLYLRPLYARVAQNKGRVYPDYDQPIILMIDVKTKANRTYRELERVLSNYSSMLTSFRNGKVTFGAVTVVISGHKPYGMLALEERRFAFIDEDLRKVSRDSSSANVFSMASCKYSRLLRWNGKGPIPPRQEQRLENFVTMAHRIGTKVRLWASPERKVVWDELLKCGVDLINTDRLAALSGYLNTNTNPLKLN